LTQTLEKLPLTLLAGRKRTLASGEKILTKTAELIKTESADVVVTAGRARVENAASDVAKVEAVAAKAAAADAAEDVGGSIEVPATAAPVAGARAGHVIVEETEILAAAVESVAAARLKRSPHSLSGACRRMSAILKFAELLKMRVLCLPSRL